MSYLDTTVITSPRARRRTLLRKRFLRRPMAVAGLIVVLCFVVLAVFAPLIAPHNPSAQDYNATFAHSSANHLLGTDEFGRDTFSRIVWAARASMQAGFFSTLLALVIAVPIGMIAGYYRGWIDAVIARLTDVLLAFPFLILAVGLAAILGPSLPGQSARLALARQRGCATVSPDGSLLSASTASTTPRVWSTASMR